MEVIFVGISNKSKNNQELSPFDETTPSGKIISEIDLQLTKKSLKTNLVQFTPVDAKGKIRYPTKDEIQNGMSNCLDFIAINSPSIVFLLGKIVEKSIITAISGNIQKKGDNYIYQNSIFVPVQHPSYIYVYKIFFMTNYVNTIVSIINENINFENH